MGTIRGVDLNELVVQRFTNRETEENHALRLAHERIDRDHASRGMSRSPLELIAKLSEDEQALDRIVERCLKAFREDSAGLSAPDFEMFWQEVPKALTAQAQAFLRQRLVLPPLRN